MNSQLCRPVMPDGSDCSNPVNFNKYIETFNCSNRDATDKMQKEMRLSFPSGHASFGFYTMIFAVVSRKWICCDEIWGLLNLFLQLYLHSRMQWKVTKLFKHVLQLTLILIALYTGLSRISDYKHHCKFLSMVANEDLKFEFIFHRVWCAVWINPRDHCRCHYLLRYHRFVQFKNISETKTANNEKLVNFISF